MFLFNHNIQRNITNTSKEMYVVPHYFDSGNLCVNGF